MWLDLVLSRASKNKRLIYQFSLTSACVWKGCHVCHLIKLLSSFAFSYVNIVLSTLFVKPKEGAFFIIINIMSFKLRRNVSSNQFYENKWQIHFYCVSVTCAFHIHLLPFFFACEKYRWHKKLINFIWLLFFSFVRFFFSWKLAWKFFLLDFFFVNSPKNFLFFLTHLNIFFF